jgi:hypothetical protein
VALRFWVTTAVAPAAMLALSPDDAAAPPGASTVAVTVTAAALVDWFCTSLFTDTDAVVAETDGVVTVTPL